MTRYWVNEPHAFDPYMRGDRWCRCGARKGAPVHESRPSLLFGIVALVAEAGALLAVVWLFTLAVLTGVAGPA